MYDGDPQNSRVYVSPMRSSGRCRHEERGGHKHVCEASGQSRITDYGPQRRPCLRRQFGTLQLPDADALPHGLYPRMRIGAAMFVDFYPQALYAKKYT